MISDKAYKEIQEKIKEQVGEKTFEYVFPAVKKALEEGDAELRDHILCGWLDCDSMRVCSHCGDIMEEGWYLDVQGYACSDECCMALMGIDKEEYDRYGIYKVDIEEKLEDEGEGRKIEDLTDEEIKAYQESIIDRLDAYYYTEWYQ